MASKVEICGVNTAKLPLYKEAEMMEMIEKVKAGDKETRDKDANNAILQIQKKFGKNAIFKGSDLQEGATRLERNKTIGGHKG